MPKIGIIGAGLIGQKRAASAPPGAVVAVCDLVKERAVKLSGPHRAAVETDWKTLVHRKDLDVVLVCTSHDLLVPCATAALKAGKHVLVEKPAGRNVREIKNLIQAEKKSSKRLRVGFNH